MSALRLSRPGYPTELVIQEPARARVAGYGQGNVHTLTLIGGPIESDPGKVEKQRQYARAWKAARK